MHRNRSEFGSRVPRAFGALRFASMHPTTINAHDSRISNLTRLQYVDNIRTVDTTSSTRMTLAGWEASMSDSPRTNMSEAEREVLKVLWDDGPLAVRDALARLTERGLEWTRSTVITLLQRLEKKGYVESDKSQHAFIFRAAVTRE